MKQTFTLHTRCVCVFVCEGFTRCERRKDVVPSSAAGNMRTARRAERMSGKQEGRERERERELMIPTDGESEPLYDCCFAWCVNIIVLMMIDCIQATWPLFNIRYHMRYEPENIEFCNVPWRFCLHIMFCHGCVSTNASFMMIYPHSTHSSPEPCNVLVRLCFGSISVITRDWFTVHQENSPGKTAELWYRPRRASPRSTFPTNLWYLYKCAHSFMLSCCLAIASVQCTLVTVISNISHI